MPDSSIATIRSEVATGRRMKRRDGFMSRLLGSRRRRSFLAAPACLAVSGSLLGGRRVGGQPGAARGHFDLGAVAELVVTLDDHDLACGEAFVHRGVQSLRGPG